VVSSSYWTHAGIANAGAVTWGNGSSTSGGISGVVSSSNSLVGSTANDSLGQFGVTSLSNGNYVVASSSWDRGSVVDAGAVTWGNGSSGISGVVSSSNSLVGSTASDQVGNSGIMALSNGNYVVRSANWDNGSMVNAGAATWGDGNTGVGGVVSSSNSLLGGTAGDQMGSGGAIALSDGRAVVLSPRWSRLTPSVLASAGRVDILSFPSSASLPLGFNTDASASSSLSASTLLAQLNAGTNVTLQASNDITLSTAVTVSNPNGNGGALTLQAGRSIVLNANLSTDNGNLTLIANETLANGVVNAYRDAGAAQITQAAGTTIDAGTGSVSIELRDGAGLTHHTTGTVTLASITAASLSVASNGFSASATASNKTYDGNSAATLSAASLSGLALQSGSNLLVVNPTTGSFANANASTGNAVTSNAFGISGYNAAQVSNLLQGSTALTAITSADINKAHLTVTADNQSRLYGAANPTLTQTLTGFVNNETSAVVTGTATASTAATASTSVGSQAITGSTTGLSATNYDFTASNGALTIAPDPAIAAAAKAVADAATAAAKTADGTLIIAKNPVVDNAVQVAQQQVSIGTNAVAAGSTATTPGNTMPSTAQSAGLSPISSQPTSPMTTDVSISGGLAFVPVADEAANAPETADLAAGFKRIFVANGGINLTQLTEDLAQ
jgi:hypothetical protein